MKDLFNALDTWNATGRDAALARVVDLDGSGPRLPGAAMAVSTGRSSIGRRMRQNTLAGRAPRAPDTVA